MDTIDLVVGDDIIVFSSVTKLGREEVLKKYKTYWKKPFKSFSYHTVGDNMRIEIIDDGIKIFIQNGFIKT